MQLTGPMKDEERSEYVTRATILRLLSDEEIARVSNAETATQLVDGDEYVDLHKPDEGVRRSLGKHSAPMGDILPRKAVNARTWRQIIGLLSTHRVEASSHSHTN